jgi:hypothetical protein
MNTNRAISRFASVALAVALAGCDDHTGERSTFRHLSVLDATHVAVHARSAPDAVVSSDGSLGIGDQPVTLTPAQQALLKQYFDAAVELNDDAIATGAAGLATAGTAIHSVVTGLASGDPDSIGPKVEAQAAKVEARAGQVCIDLAALYARQQAVADSLVTFRPYATIEAQALDGCAH